MFDEETESAFDLLTDVLVAYINDFRLEFFEGCTVSVGPAGAPPQWITCMVDGVNDPNVYWRGVPTAPGVGDEVLVWHNPLTHRREVLAASGAGGVSGGVHNLLSATHPDTTAAAVARGDLVGGRVGPVWARVGLGTTGFFLKSDGTDFNWMRISAQTCVVGPGGTDEATTLGGAVAIVNVAGPPTAANPWVIIVRGMVTAEAGDVTIPQYCHVVGVGEGSTVGMGGFTLYMSDDTSLLNLVVTGTDTATLDINGADCLLRNVRVVNDGSGSYVVYIYGDSDCKLYDVVVQTGGGINYGILVAGTATPLLVDCTVDDATNFTLAAIGLSNSANVVTMRQGKYRGNGDDIWAGASSTLYHFDVDFRPSNSTFGGTHVAQPTKRFNQWLIVAEQGGDFQELSEAITWINTLGDNTANKRYGIFMAAGNYSEAGNVAIPNYVGVFGQGWATRLDMGANELELRHSASLESLHITGTAVTYVVELSNNYNDRIIRDCWIFNTSTGYGLYINTTGGTDYLYGTVVDGGSDGIYINCAGGSSTTVYLNDCRISGDTDGLHISHSGTGAVYTEFCTIVGSTNDVNLAAGTWTYLQDGFDPDNCTITGTATPHSGQHVVYFPYTVTVGAAGTFATIQDGVNWFSNRLLCAACKLDLLDSSYAESVVIEDVFCAAEGRLEIEGDTRGMAGCSWVDNCTITSSDANAGSGTAGITNAGANITVTGSVANPNFAADGWGNGDLVIIRDNTPAIATYTISAVVGNVITLTVAAPAVGNSGTSITLIPSVAIAAGAGNNALDVATKVGGILVDGVFLDATAGAAGDSLIARSGSYVYLENALLCADDNGINADNAYVDGYGGDVSIVDCTYNILQNRDAVVRLNSCVCIGGTWGSYVQYGASLSVTSAITTGCSTAGWGAVFFGSINATNSFMIDCGDGCRGYHLGGVNANGSTAMRNTNGYHVGYNGYVYANGTCANLGAGADANTNDYVPATGTAPPGCAANSAEGNVYGVIYTS